MHFSSFQPVLGLKVGSLHINCGWFELKVWFIVQKHKCCDCCIFDWTKGGPVSLKIAISRFQAIIAGAMIQSSKRSKLLIILVKTKYQYTRSKKWNFNCCPTLFQRSFYVTNWLKIFFPDYFFNVYISC